MSDIVHDIIIVDAREELESLQRRPANVHPEELVALARAVGRGVTSKGGKHPWKCKKAGKRPFTIPNHPGTLKPGTVRMILSFIEDDLTDA